MCPENAPHEWDVWHYHHNGGERGYENYWRECKKCGAIVKVYDQLGMGNIKQEMIAANKR